MRTSRQYRGGYQSARLKTIARGFRKQSTHAESVLWNHLRNRRLLGFKFRRQHQFGEYVLDFFCSEAKLVIECDGEIHTQNEAWHHDNTRDAYLRSQGLRILRFANNQVISETDVVLNKIENYLVDEKSLSARPSP